MKIENVSFLVETKGIFSDFWNFLMTLFLMLWDVSYFDLSDPLGLDRLPNPPKYNMVTFIFKMLYSITKFPVSQCNGETKCYTVNIFLQTYFRYKIVNLILIFLFNTHRQLVINHSNQKKKKKKILSLPCERLVNLINWQWLQNVTAFPLKSC